MSPCANLVNERGLVGYAAVQTLASEHAQLRFGHVGEDVTVRYHPRDMAEVRVYFGESFLCRAINPELAGETVALKDIIRARNQRRRELRVTLAEREASVEALLRLL